MLILVWKECYFIANVIILLLICITEYDSGDWIEFGQEESNNHILFLSVSNEINSVQGILIIDKAEKKHKK